MEFKAVYDEAAGPVRIRRKGDTTREATVLAMFGDDKAWLVDDEDPDDPFTASMEYWEPVPQLTPSEALPGDVWTYGKGVGTKYRVLGVDLKAGVWHFVADDEFDYKPKPDFQIQHENDYVTVYTRALHGDSGKTLWKLVSRL